MYLIINFVIFKKNKYYYNSYFLLKNKDDEIDLDVNNFQRIRY